MTEVKGAEVVRPSGVFRRHCWMLSARLSLFSTLIVHGRAEMAIPEQSGVTWPFTNLQ